ncbi:MAG: DUF11 domain-containing protein, partial [Deltaproteobacteria bacterium]|nr:DUF11 domain-containing protein [Deltaproteobacteria bacterium]
GQNATNALISDTLPSDLNFVGPVTLDPPGSTLPAPTLPTLASGLTITAGESITLTFPVTVGASLADGTVLTNTAAVTSAEVTTPATGLVSIVVERTILLNLTKTVDDNSPQPDQVITYTVVIANTGPDFATNVTLSDTTPLSLTFISGSTAITPTGNGTTGDAPSLVNGLTITAGERVTVTYQVTVTSTLNNGDVVTNTASVTSTEVITPTTGLITITVDDLPNIYLPVILKN